MGDKRKVKATEPPGTKYTGKLCGCGISLAQPGRISMEIQAPIPPSHAQRDFKLFYGAGDQMRVPLNTASRLLTVWNLQLWLLACFSTN